MQKITPFLWFDKEAEDAAKFYVSIFKKSKIINFNPMVSTFELEGQEFMALNGGPKFKFTEAISFFISCKDQEEVDYFWEKLGEGGEEGQCGWVKDKFGLWWQVIPTRFNELMSKPDPKKSKRVMEALLKMKKIVVADLEKAYKG